MEHDFPYEQWQVNVVSNVNKDWPEVFIVEAKKDAFVVIKQQLWLKL